MKEIYGLYSRDKEETYFPRLYSSEEYAWKVLNRYMRMKNSYETNQYKTLWGEEDYKKDEYYPKSQFKQYPPHGFYQNGWGETFCISKLKIH